ncbi:MAG: hypothetical protein H0X30_19700 [Anaerolineae bacterium]|nr:hypothetical protein [Anaerolineae bacterium]
MKSRLLALCMMFVLIAALVPGVMAQDTSKLVCGNLSADDCTALTTAFTNTGSAGSGAFTLAATFDVQSDDASQAGKVDITADGKFSGVPPMMSMTDMTAMSADPSAALTKFTDTLKGFSGELNLTIGLPTAAAAMTGGEPLTLNLILVNGIGYVDLSKLPASIAPLLEQMKLPKGWAGLDLIDTATNLGGMMTANTPEATSAAPATAAEDLPKVEALAAKYLTYTHDGDTYTGTLDAAGLANDADFQALAKSADTKPMTPEQQAAMDSLKDAKFQFAFTVTDSKLTELKITVNVPGSTLTAINAASASSDSSSDAATTVPPKEVNVTIDLKYSGLGEAQTIAAPDGAPVAKYADLMTLVGGMMGGGTSG